MFIVILFLAQSLAKPNQLEFGPCVMNQSLKCATFFMEIAEGTRAFTMQDFGMNVNSISHVAKCRGYLTRGSFRYFVNGTSPSSLVGTLVPQPPSMTLNDTTGTLEYSATVVLYQRYQILGFKATQSNWGGAEMSWECAI